MINELTEDQTAQMEVYKDKWIDIGLSTEEIDVEKAMEALTRAYAAADLVAPKEYEVYDSPFEAIQVMKTKYDITVTPSDFIYGAHDASWLSFYDYFKDVVNLTVCNKLSGLIDFAKYSGWALLFDDLIVLTRKPVEIKFDEDKLTHCEDGLAIRYADNTGVAAWHGTTIPQEWIFDKSTITPEVLFQWDNVEQRRCACEILGWATVLDNLKATVINEDSDPTIGTLLEVDLPDSGKERFLVALDPNVAEKVGIPVPYEMTTALEANSWTYGIDKFDFKPSFRV